MSKLKELLVIFIFAMINMAIAFSITHLFGISNMVIFKSYALTFGDITWEFLFFMILSLIEAYIYEYFINK